MATSYRYGDHLTVFVEATEAPYTFNGTFVAEDNDYIHIVSTLGDNINNNVTIPKRRVTHIEWTRKKEDHPYEP